MLMKYAGFVSLLLLVSAFGYGTPQLNTLELNGILRFQGNDKVSIKDRFSGESSWLEVGQSFYEIQVEAIRKDSPEVVLRQGNTTRTIGLQTGKIVRLREGPLVVKRDSDADIAFDAMQTIIFERGQELAKKRIRREP